MSFVCRPSLGSMMHRFQELGSSLIDFSVNVLRFLKYGTPLPQLYKYQTIDMNWYGVVFLIITSYPSDEYINQILTDKHDVLLLFLVYFTSRLNHSYKRVYQDLQMFGLKINK